MLSLLSATLTIWFSHMISFPLCFTFSTLFIPASWSTLSYLVFLKISIHPSGFKPGFLIKYFLPVRSWLIPCLYYHHRIWHLTHFVIMICSPVCLLLVQLALWKWTRSLPPHTCKKCMVHSRSSISSKDDCKSTYLYSIYYKQHPAV